MSSQSSLCTTLHIVLFPCGLGSMHLSLLFLSLCVPYLEARVTRRKRTGGDAPRLLDWVILVGNLRRHPFPILGINTCPDRVNGKHTSIGGTSRG